MTGTLVEIAAVTGLRAQRGTSNGEALEGRPASGGAPELWDGQTAARIVDVFEAWWNSR